MGGAPGQYSEASSGTCSQGAAHCSTLRALPSAQAEHVVSPTRGPSPPGPAHSMLPRLLCLHPFAEYEFTAQHLLCCSDRCVLWMNQTCPACSYRFPPVHVSFLNMRHVPPAVIAASR